MTQPTQFRTVAVVGAGAWGAALALAAARAGRQVLLWARDEATVAAITATGCAPRLPGVALPAAVTATASLADLRAARMVVLAVPTQSLRQVCEALALALPPGLPVISAAKGIERETGFFTAEIVADAWPGSVPAVLSGPSFAADLGAGLPTAVTLACADGLVARGLAEALSSPLLRIYHGADPRGVEIGGAAKNVLAIAAGVAIGLGLGESARAALVARGFAELTRFGAAYGAQGETLMGLSGLGDVMLSCASAQSRNFAFGFALGRGESLAQAGGGRLAEGVFTAAVLVQMAQARSVEMPIATAVAALVAGQASVRETVDALLARPPRAEN